MRLSFGWARALAPLGALMLGAATCEQAAQPLRADFDAPQGLALVCLREVADETGSFCPEELDEAGNPRAGATRFATVPLTDCNQLRFQLEEDPDNNTNTVVPNSFLFLLVTNNTRGDVGVVSLNSSNVPQILDSDASLPGINFIPAGEFPRAIVADASSKRFVTANTGSNDLSVFENTDQIRCFSNKTAPSTIPLGGSPNDLVLDENGIVYATLPDQGELVAVDVRQNPPAIVGRADLRQGAPGPMRPSRVAVSEARRVAYVSNPAGTFIAEVNLDELVQGQSQVSFINLGERTGAIAYQPALLFEFQGELQGNDQLPNPLDVPETLYAASVDNIGEIVVIDAEARAPINLRPEDPLGIGPRLRVGFASDLLDPIVDIRFFSQPLLPIFGDPENPFIVERVEKPDNLQGVFALVTTNNLTSFVVNIATNDAKRRCCAIDGNVNSCIGSPIDTLDDGTCPEDVFLPEQATHTLRNTNLSDQPFINANPSLTIGSARINLENAVVDRIPALGTAEGCISGGGCSADPEEEDIRIELPKLPNDRLAEGWLFHFEGPIPGTDRQGALFAANELSDAPIFCERGVEAGDILQIVTPLAANAPAECANLSPRPAINANGAFNPNGSTLDEGVTAELTIEDVRAGTLRLAPLPGVTGPADLSACYGGVVAYRIRVNDVFLVSGGEESHAFLHRQLTNPDGSCGIDPNKNELFTARARLGEVFRNIAFAVEVTDATPPTNAEGVAASFRDVQWVFAMTAGFTPWGIDPDNSAQTGNANITGGVVVTPDGVNAFVSDSNLDRVFNLILPAKDSDPDPIF